MITGSARFARIRARAQAALEWERWAPAVLPGALFLLAFIALALFGVWERLGDPWRLIALLAALGGGAWLAWRSLKRSRPVSLESALRRIEEDSALHGRPFEALTDAPAALRSDPDLWRAHVTRMARQAAKARAGRPHAALAASDRMALRAGVLVILLLGVGIAGGRAPGRVADAFLPGVLTASRAAPLVDAWIQPPGYTGAAPVFLTASQEIDEAAVFRAPAGSELTVRISGVRRPPATRVADDDGRRRLRFEALQDDVHETKTLLTSDSVVTVSRAGRWTIAATLDSPPEVAFTARPEPEDNNLNLAYRAADDYGVTALTLMLELDGEADEVPLNLGGVTPRETEEQLALDLTEHRWAGQHVNMTLKAQDAPGQEGFSETVEARIPQRIFLSPLAKAVAEQRQILMNSGEPYAELAEPPPMTSEDVANLPDFTEENPERRIERAPEGVRIVADMLGATMMGAERYFTDYTVYMGLAEARGELQQAREQAAIEDVPPLLWQIALRVETGDLADAEAALRAAERALLEALARGADADELAQLFDAFQQAMNRYLEALAREAIEQGRVVEAQEGGGQAPEGLDMQSVQDLLDAIREASELGDEAGARAALAALTELLRNMEMQITLGGAGQGGEPREQTPEQRAMQDALNELSDMIGDQRELMDETLQEGGGEQGQEGQEGQQGQEGQEGQQGEGAQPGQQGGQPGGEGGQAQAGQSGQPGGQQGQPGQGQPGQGQPGQGQPGQGQPGEGGQQAGQNGPDGQQPGQGGRGGNRQGISPSELAGRQGALGERLDQLGEQIGEGARGGAASGDPGDTGEGSGAGELLDQARRAMREAENALRRGDTDSALAAQEDALNALRDGARQMANQQDEDSEENRAAGEREQYDPMGRSAGGTAGAGDNVRVPDEMERQRAREILDELRRRAGERRRPELELDYLRRLLERF
jgi:hypothetical protein